MEKKIVYVDMDNVLVDFKSGIDKIDKDTFAMYDDRLDEVPGIFSLMTPMEDAIETYEKLCNHLIPISFQHHFGKMQLH
jgi:beta-phosphoglucomutase-like phosphatase (HAD superfamily)